MNTTTVGSLRAGDVIIDDDGMELRVLSVARTPGSRIVTLTLEFVEPGVLAVRPAGPWSVRMSVNSMVVIPA